MLKIKQILSVFLLFCSTIAMAQERTVTGTVSGANKAAISGVTVAQKGTATATVTNDAGAFSLKVAGNNVVLVFSSVGFASKEVSVSAATSEIAVDLADDNKQLGEVVVTALGIQRQVRSLTYSTQKVAGEKLGEAREINVINGLQGKVAGLTITKNATGPGSSSKVILRGNRSIAGGNQPLYVIDGVPLDNSSSDQASNTFGGRDGGDGIGMVNPDEIETMSILKGASAAALYGASGQNGAIIITTKRAKTGKIALDYNGGVMFDQASVFPELQYDYAQGDGGQYFKNSEHSWGPKISGQSDTLWNGDVVKLAGQTNRLKDFFRTGTSLTNSISATGGNDKMQTYFFYGNTRAQGIMRNNDLMRHNVTLRVSNTISNKFTIESKISYIFEDVNNKPFIGEAPNSQLSLYRSPVTIPLSEMQKYETIATSGEPVQSYWHPGSSILENPFWILNRDLFYERKDRIIGLAVAKYVFADWLNVQVRGSFDKTIEKRESKVYDDSYYSLVGSNYAINSQNHISTNIDFLVNFRKALTSNLVLSGNIGGAIQQGRYEGLNVNANGLNKQNFFFMSVAKSPLLNNYLGRNPQIQSLYATAALAYKNYLFLEGTAREDWSSALPLANAHYFYPSIGLTGVISDMVVLPSWITYAKVRATYAGSGGGGNAYFDRNYYTFSNAGAPSQSSVRAVANYKPELTTSYEIGLDWRFFNSRLGFDVTFYKSDTKNQLLQIATPQASLYDSKYINAGLIQNHGVEAVITGTPIKTRDFSWDMTANFAKNKNKVVRLFSPSIKEATLIGDRRANIKVKEGGAYGDMYVQGWLRDDQGRHLVDANGEMIKTAGYDTYLGNYNPDWTLGFNNQLTYKAFSFSFLIDYRKGGYVISGTQALIDADGHSKRSLEGRDGMILDGYTVDGKKNDKTIDGSTFWSFVGDRYSVGELYGYSATNLRMREVTLGYQIPASVLGKTNFLKGAKLSLVGRNLFFFKRDAPFDPEIGLGTGNGGGLEYGSLPATRSMGVNLKLSF